MELIVSVPVGGKEPDVSVAAVCGVSETVSAASSAAAVWSTVVCAEAAPDSAGTVSARGGNTCGPATYRAPAVPASTAAVTNNLSNAPAPKAVAA